MATDDQTEPREDGREPYEPPCVTEVVEFETTALAACGKLVTTPLCVAQNMTMNS